MYEFEQGKIFVYRSDSWGQKSITLLFAKLEPGTRKSYCKEFAYHRGIAFSGLLDPPQFAPIVGMKSQPSHQEREHEPVAGAVDEYHFENTS